MKSLLKVLNIIEVVAAKGSAGIQEISNQTGYPPPTVHRIVSTLVKRAYLKQDPNNRAYRLSFRFLELGTQVQQQFSLIAVARPFLQHLVEASGENANLVIEDGDDVIYVDHVRGNQLMQLFTRLGARAPLYCTGVGKLMLSERSLKAKQQYLATTQLVPHTVHTLAAPEALLAELDKIRQQGYAVDDEEMAQGVRCVAALVRNYAGQPVGAISVSGAAMRISKERIPELSGLVKETALEISRELGFAN
jgi:DNA-binding IclR family transcriptional regulator